MVSMDSNEVASDQRPESFLASFIVNWIHSGRQTSLIDLVDDAISESRSKIRNQLSRLPNESLLIHELGQASGSSVLTLSKIVSLLEDANKHFDNVENELIPLLNTIGKELRDQIRIEEGIKSMMSAKDSLNYKRIPSYDDFSHLEEDEVDTLTLGGVKTPKDFETPTDSNAISKQSLVGKMKARRASIPDVPEFSDCETSYLLSARKIIFQDLMEQFPVGSDADADDGNQDGDANQEDAPTFSFAFPRCQVSKSALALIDLVMQILDEAEMIIFSEDANQDANRDANRDVNRDANEDANNKDAKLDPENFWDAVKSEDGASGGNKDTIPVKEKALKLYITASKAIRLYQLMTPVKNKKLIKNSLTASALFHNNCLFMAHFLLTSPQIQDAPAQIKDSKILGANSDTNSFGAKSSDANFGAKSSRPGFNQIASLLEDEGRHVIQEAMREEKYKFIEFFNSSSVLTSLIENATLSDDLKPFEFAAKKSIYLLNAISNSWKEILPIGVYNHLIGNLISFIFDEIISKILSIEDISASSANRMSQIMKYFQKECFETALRRTDIKSEDNLKDANKTGANLFNTQVPSSFKFNELRNALTASLADIVNRWGDGYGPLSMAFTDVQIKKLIRALFQNSEIRAVALSRIRNAEQN